MTGSTTSINELNNAIARAQAKLTKQAKSKGISENFGQKEIRAINDKYIHLGSFTGFAMHPVNKAILDFEIWVDRFEL